MIDQLKKVNTGFNPLEKKENSRSIDYLRSGILPDTKLLQPVDGNELAVKLTNYLSPAIENAAFEIFVYGDGYAPILIDEQHFTDISYTVREVHLNQGNKGFFSSRNGVWQDGAIFIHNIDADTWKALYFAFHDQSFKTNDTTGDPASK